MNASGNSLGPPMIDAHNHIHFKEFDADRDEVLARAATTGIKAMLAVGIDPVDSERAIAVSLAYPAVYASIGIHPQLADRYSFEDVMNLESLACSRVIAVGETGFDLYRSPTTERLQRSLFEAHVELARKLRLPLVIHDRQAHEHTLAVLDETQGWNVGGVFHCFSGDTDLAMDVLDRGFHISIPGVVTYPNARKLMDVVRAVPLERMLVETDAPYLSPHPMRGRRNEPSYMARTVEEIARIKNVSPEDVAGTTRVTFQRLFLPEDV